MVDKKGNALDTAVTSTEYTSSTLPYPRPPKSSTNSKIFRDYPNVGKCRSTLSVTSYCHSPGFSTIHTPVPRPRKFTYTSGSPSTSQHPRFYPPAGDFFPPFSSSIPPIYDLPALTPSTNASLGDTNTTPCTNGRLRRWCPCSMPPRSSDLGGAYPHRTGRLHRNWIAWSPSQSEAPATGAASASLTSPPVTAYFGRPPQGHADFPHKGYGYNPNTSRERGRSTNSLSHPSKFVRPFADPTPRRFPQTE